MDVAFMSVAISRTSSLVFSYSRLHQGSHASLAHLLLMPGHPHRHRRNSPTEPNPNSPPSSPPSYLRVIIVAVFTTVIAIPFTPPPSPELALLINIDRRRPFSLAGPRGLTRQDWLPNESRLPPPPAPAPAPVPAPAPAPPPQSVVAAKAALHPLSLPNLVVAAAATAAAETTAKGEGAAPDRSEAQ